MKNEINHHLSYIHRLIRLLDPSLPSSYTVASKWLIIFWPHPLWILLSIISGSLLFGKSSNGALRVTKSDLLLPPVFEFRHSISLIEFSSICIFIYASTNIIIIVKKYFPDSVLNYGKYELFIKINWINIVNSHGFILYH